LGSAADEVYHFEFVPWMNGGLLPSATRCYFTIVLDGDTVGFETQLCNELEESCGRLERVEDTRLAVESD
jgi:hypothetical protein